MISGSDDPITPPSYAKQTLPLFPNARMMLVNGAAHQSDYPPCVYRAIASFYRSRSASQLDLDRCAATYRRPPFATLTYFESAAGEDPALTARFRAVFTDILKGRIDRAQLTPTLSKDYPDAVLRQIASQAAGKGALESFVYRGASRFKKGMAYGYLAHFVQANANVRFTLNAAGKVTECDISVI
jgi:TAP-like protein